jgi:26S proteasome regulatory subunit N12
MDPKMTEVTQMFARFKTAYACNDLNTCVTLLSQLKVRYPASLDLYCPPFTSRCPSFSRKFHGWGGSVISG